MAREHPPALQEDVMEYVPFLRFHVGTTQAAVAVSMVLLVGGLTALLYGWKLYRILLVISCGLAAAYLGWFFLRSYVPPNYEYLVPVVLGLLGALLAIPIQNAVVFFLGAAIGFVSLGPVAADLIWRSPNGPTPTQYLIAGIVAFVVMGVFALFLLRPAIVIATSMLGATLLLSAGVHLVEAASSRSRDIYSQYPFEMAWAYVALIVTGVIFQATLVSRGKREE